MGENREGRNPRHVRAWSSAPVDARLQYRDSADPDRKSTRLNSSHLGISYAVFCLKKNTDRAEADAESTVPFVDVTETMGYLLCNGYNSGFTPRHVCAVSHPHGSVHITLIAVLADQ